MSYSTAANQGVRLQCKETFLAKTNTGIIFICFVFLKEVSYAQQGCICLSKNTVKTVLLCNMISVLINCFIIF